MDQIQIPTYGTLDAARGSIGIPIQHDSQHELPANTRPRETWYQADTHGNAGCCRLLRLLRKMLRPDRARDTRRISGCNGIRGGNILGKDNPIKGIHPWIWSDGVPF